MNLISLFLFQFRERSEVFAAATRHLNIKSISVMR